MIDGIPNRPLYFYQKDISDPWWGSDLVSSHASLPRLAKAPDVAGGLGR